MASDELRKRADAIIAEVRRDKEEDSGVQKSKEFLTFFKIYKKDQEETSLVLHGLVNILKQDNKLEQKAAEEDRKEREREKKEKAEKLIESLKGGVKAAAGVGKALVNTLISPFRKVWDNIINFLKVVVAGFLFNKIFNWFLDPENKRKINSLGRFLKDYWPALATFGLLFLTPLGGIIKGLLAFVAWAVPMLVKLIARNPLLAGGILLAGMTITQLMKKMEADQNAITKEFEQRRDAGETFGGKSLTRDQVETEYFARNGTVMGNLSRGFLNNMVNPISRIFQTGGQVIGPSHNRGGVDIEVEGGEYIVNKKRAGILGPILDWLNFGNLNRPPVQTTPMGFPSLGDKKLQALLKGFIESANSPSPRVRPVTPSSSVMGNRPLRVSPPPPPPNQGVTVIKNAEVLPTINQINSRQMSSDGKTIPNFMITSSSTQRTKTLLALDLE